MSRNLKFIFKIYYDSTLTSLMTTTNKYYKERASYTKLASLIAHTQNYFCFNFTIAKHTTLIDNRIIDVFTSIPFNKFNTNVPIPKANATAIKIKCINLSNSSPHSYYLNNTIVRNTFPQNNW